MVLAQAIESGPQKKRATLKSIRRWHWRPLLLLQRGSESTDGGILHDQIRRAQFSRVSVILKRPKEVRGSLSNVVASHATGENAFLIEGFKSDIRECSAVFGRRRAGEGIRRRSRV